MHGASKSVSCQSVIASSLFHFPLDVSYAFTLFLYYFEYLFIRWMKSVKKERHRSFQSSPISSNLWIFLSSSIYQLFKFLKRGEDRTNFLTFSIATVVASRSITGRSGCRQIKMIGLLAHFPPLLSFFFLSLSLFLFTLREDIVLHDDRETTERSSDHCRGSTFVVHFIFSHVYSVHLYRTVYKWNKTS